MLDTTQSDYAAAQLPRKAMVEELVPFVSANAWIKAAMHCRFNIDPQPVDDSQERHAGPDAPVRGPGGT